MLDQPQSSPDALESHSDAALVALARRELARGEAGLRTARRCVALIYERRRGLVRALCAARAPLDQVDDLEAAVYDRFVHVAYLGREPMTNPAGLLVVITRRVIATHYARGDEPAVPFDELTAVGVMDNGYSDVEAMDAVERLLGTLSVRQRDAVWLRIQEGLPSVEIAERLETTAGNVDVMVFRAMRKLREKLER